MGKLIIDCLILIFNELQKENKSLYSCLLVNKEWCHLVVPILWEKCQDFSICDNSKEKLSNTILSCLPTSSKQLLLENNIRLPQTILSKPLTFNYVSFCKFISYKIIINIKNMVFKEKTLRKCNYSKEGNLLEQEIYKLFISQCKNIKRLKWINCHPLSLFPGALTCFSQLYSLALSLSLVNSNDLFEMAHICKHLNQLTVYGCSQDVPGLISLINAQRNLKSVSLSFNIIKKGNCEELSKVLAKKGCTIDNLTLYNSVGAIPHSFLTSFVNLKNLTIRHDYESDEKEIKELQKYLSISKFPNFETLDFDSYSPYFKELAMLIEETKGNITYISITTFNKSAENTGMLIKAIANNCPNINYLTTYLGPEDLIYVKSLLINCENLTNLCFKSLNSNYNIGDELLDILTKFSPKGLCNIRISGEWEYSIDAFKKFFESFRERKLLCFNIIDN
ncbi:hypothetical protein RclHR1_01190016 [Rhizophagus clarus]|uniref:F-box domain-containing protein n=1 Tax=Rhizophagus clarus TaxID=94130 RepID=A0A2Z6Q5L7_9GLOM|nr:hypothetical protein RclHR1_01190016 [Rhizophagus clarus]GET02120.1 hypothetical protein GLOIN_2v1810887 [Rhizophagus clarus]